MKFLQAIPIVAISLATAAAATPASATEPTMAPMPGMTMRPMPGMTASPKPTSSPKATPSPIPASTMEPMRGAMTPTPSASRAASMPGMTMGTPPPTATPASMMHMHGDSMGAMTMKGSTDAAVPMEREGSGTSWQPDSSPEYGAMHMTATSMLMTHYAAFPRFVETGSARGSRRFDAPNWFMTMGSSAVGANAQLGYRAMISLDPLTENRVGYPLLYQTGETAYGAPLHDRQHPHDLFSELSVSYSVKTSSHASAYVYLGYPGEPALGPPTYMHRPIAYDMADAPIGHHWQDATHVTFGVGTIGYDFGRFKIEGSSFTGAEPNEFRYNFDRPTFDSFSERISWNPSTNLALQFSSGYLKAPESTEPTLDEHRTTASVLYARRLGYESGWYGGFVWGQNRLTDGTSPSNSYLLETDYRRAGNAYYARLERVQKSGKELVPFDLLAQATMFDVGAYTFGYVHDLNRQVTGTRVGLGVQFTVSPKPSSLDPYYGTQTPTSFQIFLRLRPTETTVEGMMK